MYQTHSSGESVAWNCEISVTLWEVLVYHIVRLTSRFICSKKVVEDFQDVHFSKVTVEGRFVDSNMNGLSSFSSTLFAILVCYLKVGDVGSGVIVGNTAFVNCTGDMTIAFFYSIFQTSA